MQNEFKERRDRVLSAIHPGVLVVSSAPLAIRNNDVEHEYRQDSDFFYLTGFDEPESVLVLNSGSEQPCTLFVRDPLRVETANQGTTQWVTNTVLFRAELREALAVSRPAAIVKVTGLA